MSWWTCGCCPTSGDDDPPYERLDENRSSRPRQPETNIVQARPRNEAYQNGGYDTTDGGVSEGSPTPVRSKADMEADALNKILETTQQSIIDVTHLDGMSLNANEYLQKTRLYEDAIRQHDARVAKLAPVTPEKRSHGRLLEDNGSKIGEWLGRVALTTEKENESRAAAHRMSEALKAGVQIKHASDLIVNMDLDFDL